MNRTENVIQGTIQPDGTLVLDEPTNLPAGRVTVVLRPKDDQNREHAEGHDFFDAVEAIWARQNARGHRVRSPEEIEHQRSQIRAELETGLQAAIRLQEECRQGSLREDSDQSSP